MRNIPFSPPDIREADIRKVESVLRSGWITTGNETAAFEKALKEYTCSGGVICLSSGTAALIMALKLLGIGAGDEVITTPYTYTATAAAIIAVGARPVFADIYSNSYEIDPDSLRAKLTPRTKAVIPVDYAGIPANYDGIKDVLIDGKQLFSPRTALESELGRPFIIGDAAHALGAEYKGTKIGNVADFTAFSFHAVKNLTTAEGGALLWRDNLLSNSEFYTRASALSVNGQSKSAYQKSLGSNFSYDVTEFGYKCNMPDVLAALALTGLSRYNETLSIRRKIVEFYNSKLKAPELILPVHETIDYKSSYHLYPIRIKGIGEAERNGIIESLYAKGISANVHYKPLPLLTAYKNAGYKIEDVPNAYNMYINEITLPLYSTLSLTDAEYVVECLLEIIYETRKNRRK